MLKTTRTELESGAENVVDCFVAIEAIADFKGWSCTQAQDFVWSMIRRSPRAQMTFTADAEYRFERVA